VTETSALFFLTEGGGADHDSTFDKVLITLSGAAGQDGPVTVVSQGGDVSPDALIAVPADGIYFISDYVGDGGEGEVSEVFEEHFSSPLTYTNPLNSIDQSGVFGSGSGGNPNYGADTIDDFAIDAAHNILYFVDGKNFIEDSFSGAGFTGAVTKTTLATLPGPAQEIALDLANHTAYFTGHSGSESLITAKSSYGPGSPSHNIYSGHYTGNYIYKVSGVTTSATAGALTNDVTKIAVPFGDGLVEGIASFNGTLYFTTQPTTSGAGVTGDFGIYDIPVGAASPNQIGTVWAAADSSALASAHIAQMGQITIDPESGEYYVSTELGTIFASNVSSSAAPTLVVNANTISGLSSTVQPEGLFIDPAGTVSNISVAAIDGSTGITAGEIGVGDTITIAVTFNAAETVTGTPSLTLNDGATASYASGSGSDVLYFVYKPQSGQNVKTLAVTAINGTFEDGLDMAASTAEDSATFSSVAVDTTPTALTLSGTSIEFVQGAGNGAVLASAAISDPDGNGTLSGAYLTIANYDAGDVLGIGGAASGTSLGLSFSAAGGTLTLSGNEPDASYASVLEMVTYKDTGTDGSTGAHPVRNLDWSVTESTAGGSLVGHATTSITIDRPPVITGGGYDTAVIENSEISGGTGAALAGDTDPDGDALTITGISDGGGTVTAGSALAGLYGSLTLNSDGSYTYDASNTAAIGAAADGAPPADQFTFTVSDAKGGTATEVFAVTIDRPPTLSGTGTVTYSSGGTAVSVDSTITLADPDAALITSATIAINAGFLAGDTLSGDVAGTNINAAYSAADGILDLTGSDSAADYQAVLQSISYSYGSGDPTQGGGDPSRDISFQVSDAASAASFMLSATVDVTNAICYLRGTRILTPTGEALVENLAIGDAVVTRFAGIQKIQWIGRQSFDPRFLRNNREKIPVRIRAGALGKHLPARDLFVSPGHSMLLGDTLVLASALVNGVTVTQAFDAGSAAHVDYYQIDLGRHDCVIAEGTWSETFADGPGLREQFHNAATFAALYPDILPAEELQLCAPRPEHGPELEAALRPVVAAAAVGLVPGPLEAFIDSVSSSKIEGWAFDPDHSDLPLLLEVLVGTEVIGTILACDPREDLRQAGKGTGRCAFCFIPPKPLPPPAWPSLRLRRAVNGAEIPMTELCRAGINAAGRSDTLIRAVA